MIRWRSLDNGYAISVQSAKALILTCLQHKTVLAIDREGILREAGGRAS